MPRHARFADDGIELVAVVAADYRDSAAHKLKRE